jgi:hypothetical protein
MMVGFLLGKTVVNTEKTAGAPAERPPMLRRKIADAPP